jgi:hypothetical protein
MAIIDEHAEETKKSNLNGVCEFGVTTVRKNC